MKIIKPLFQHNPNPKLGEILRKAREEKGLTVRQVADEVMCSSTLVTRIELAQREASNLNLLKNFSKVLNIPLENLLSAFFTDDTSISITKMAYPYLKDAHLEEMTWFSKQVQQLKKEDFDTLNKFIEAWVMYCNKEK